jgi:phosphate/sulfate permease
MKKEVPIWAVIASAVVVLVVIGWFVWNRTAATYGEKVVPVPYNSSNPYGNSAPSRTGPGGSPDNKTGG